MKRALTLMALVLSAACLFAACGGQESSSSQSGGQSQESSSSSQTSSSQESSSQESSESSQEPEQSGALLDETAIKEILTEKLPLAGEVYNIFAGGGLECQLPEEQEYNEQGQCFVPVTSETYRTTQDLRNAAEAVFTKAYAQQRFFQYGLEGDHVRYQDVDGQLMIDIGQGGGSNLYNWNLDTLKIVEQTEDRIVVNMDYISSYGEAGNADLTLLKEDGQWKFTDDFA